MTALVRRLAGRAVGYYSVADLIPLYAVYALLFRDSGLSAAEVSSLLVIWSVTAFVMEVPSGAWADTVSRRALLVLSALLNAAAFSTWIVAPSYPGFAAGFVLWGVGNALMSGTFEALLYDELAALDADDQYARVLGWANSGSMIATLAATVIAAPLFSLGGYPLLGWVSVAVTLGQALIATGLPVAPRVAQSDDTGELTGPGSAEGSGGVLRRYLAMLRAGVGEVTRERMVRRGVLLVALVTGLLAFDEYFPLVAREQGAGIDQIPLLIALTIVGQAIGTSLAGRTAGMRGRTVAGALVVAAASMAWGVYAGGWLGFAALGAGYGVAANVVIVIEARVQDAISGPARATVTSVGGLASETFAVAVFAGFAIGSAWFTTSVLAMALMVPLVLVAGCVPRWLPRGRCESPNAAADSRR